MGKIFWAISTGLVAYISYAIYNGTSDTPAPTLPTEEYWGPSSSKGKAEDISIRPFEIKVEENILKDLKARLKTELSSNRFAKPLEGIGFEYGFNSDFVKEVGQYWLDKYEWKAREKLLNQYPHFKTKLSGIDLHFVRVKSSNNKKYKVTKPLLLVHGWPGSFVEFSKAIPLLLDPPGTDINFELVIPSIPGYGFSEPAHQPGFGTLEAAQLFHKLMTRLGYKKYYAQGGDWGSMITTHMASLYPESVEGLHLNMCHSAHPRSQLKLLLTLIAPRLFLTEREISRSLFNNFGLFLRESGYFHLQASKPDTIGVSLSNSPTGLAAYILEKFSGWTNLEWISKQNGGLVPYFKMDELLDNVMIYWVTNSITTSMRFYSESLGTRARQQGMDRVPVTIPTACFNAPAEFFFTPRFILTDKYPNLIRYTNAVKGGHFAAFEVPDIFAKDVIEFIKQIEFPPPKK